MQTYTLIDDEFDFCSDDLTAWYPTAKELGGWPSRIPASLTEFIPLTLEPCMLAEPQKIRQNRSTVSATTDNDNWTTFLHQALSMPTLERGRFWPVSSLRPKHSISERPPLMADMFRAP